MRYRIGDFHEIALIITICLIGCGTTKAYQGEARPSRELARLLAHGVRFHAVNGEPVSTFSSSVLVLPGKNTITLSSEPGSYTARDVETTERTIEFEAVADTTYAVTAQRGDGRLCAFPISKVSGEVDMNSPAGCLKARTK